MTRLTAHELRAVAVAASADPRTVARVAGGGKARGMVDTRIRDALVAMRRETTETPETPAT